MELPVTFWHVFPLAITVMLSIAVGLWVWRTRREVRGVSFYLLLVLFGGILWPLQLIVHIRTNNWELARFLVESERFTGYLTTFLWVTFVAEYTNSKFHRHRWVQACFGAVTLGYLLLWATNSFHRLLFVDVVQVSAPFLHGSAVRGPVYYVLLAFTYTFVIFGIYALIRFLSETRSSAHRSILYITTGALGVAIANLTSLAGLGPVSTFQYDAYGSLPFLLTTVVGLFRVGMFDLAPVARTTLVESMNDAVIVVDEQRRIVDYNRRAVALWPELAQLAGGTIQDVCPALAREAQFTGASDQRSQITLDVDGEERHYSLLVSPVESDGNGTGIVGYSLLLRDVSELESSRKTLQRQNERLDHVAASITHDLRNPLNAADGHLSLLHSGIDDPELREHADSVTSAHDRMDDIINDVLALARGELSVEDPDPVSLANVTAGAWENIDGDGTIVVNDSTTILADRSRLLSVFENLFRNAVEHGSTDDVTITVETIENGFAVTDDGSGIPAEERDQAFEIGHTTSDQGTGYGLHIVDQVVAAHDWSLRLTEGDSGGARFEITGVEYPADDQRPVSDRDCSP